MKQVDINEGINNTLLLLNHRLNQGIEVIHQYDTLPLVECYPAQLNQVFWHIISNAIDELLSHPQLTFQPQILIQTKLVTDKQVEVRIRDNGKGISSKIKEKYLTRFSPLSLWGKEREWGWQFATRLWRNIGVKSR
jgi:signal transduction histidine kinase